LTCELTTPACPVKEKIEKDIRERIAAVFPGVRELKLTMTGKVRTSNVPTNDAAENLLPQIKHILLVGAGKGGVGKSTCALNLALALRQLGASVALLDADLYGPSIPIMTGIREKPKLAGDTKIFPMKAFGIELMSMGLLVEFNQAMIWRGPVLDGIVVQFLRDVVWSPADYLVVDLPPGTGDVILSIAQNCSVTGAVLVSTPQKVALADVVRARTMFKQTRIPVLGMIENMSAATGADGRRLDVFSSGGAEIAAREMALPFLGSIPLDPAICASGDAGVPLLISAPDSPAGRAFLAAAGQLAAQVSMQALAEANPTPTAAEAHSLI
jgi:ATP-binding protein involved in chromosome partitioning